MGPMMGERPSKIAIHSHDSATIRFETSTGHLWWKVKGYRLVKVFAENGKWFWRSTGRGIFGWSEIELNAAHRLWRRDELDLIAKRKSGRLRRMNE